ncbi:MAG: response regulator [Anaerolineales bacterium]|nr:response regulator [Anaerolineales bacterium]MCB8954012.1 response regulator [Ardenticatenales bacterium]
MVVSARILLIEDDLYLLEGTADLLELAEFGYNVEVIRATNGLEGLEQMSTHAPDLIISDIMMPLMNGLEFLVRVRQHPEWLHIPLIFLTAKGDKQDILRGRTLGAELYISKPFEAADLLSLVKSQLARTFQLRQAREKNLAELKDSILLVLNHEFRTPLTYVTAYNELLAEGVNRWESTEALQAYLQGIQEGCQRLIRLVDDLIAIIELRTGEAASLFQERAGPVRNAEEQLRNAGIVHEGNARGRQVTLYYDLPHNLPPVWGVPEDLFDVFNRLIDNAVRFTAYSQRPDRSVTLTARATDDQVRFSVSDNGIGLPGHVHTKVFDLFYQYNRQMLEQQGTGVGLAIVKGVVEMHGGRVEVESTENAGTTFTVILPTHQNNQPGITHLSPPARAQVTILIVEDDYYLLQGLRDLLEFFYNGPYQFNVLTATNGQHALDVLARNTPQLIISDVMMPKMDGFQLLEHVRANPDWVEIPFIFLTARGDKQDIQHGRSIGAEEYIPKPYNTNDLLTLVTTQLNRYFQVQDVLTQNFIAFKRSILNLLQPDLRLPLDQVNVYSRQLTENLQNANSDFTLKASLQGLQSASQHLTRLVENFITLVEIKTGEASSAFEYRAGPLEGIGALFHLIVDTYHSLPENARIHFFVEIASQLPAIFGDSEALGNGLEQFVYSGCEACRQVGGKEMYFAIRAHKTEVHISMRIPALVFSPPEADRLRALFANNDDGIVTVPLYGPALTVVKGIIDLHKGRVEMDNDKERGCTMTIVLPASAP